MTDKTRPSSFRRNVQHETYPRPDHEFAGARIGMTYKESEPDYPQGQEAPEGAPNIVLVLLDDVGFGWPSTYGGLVRTPTADRLASIGLTYCQFHTTALCAPTRAALLTGRNRHSVATGVVAEMATGYPGYSGILPRSCATIGELLSANGYATAWFGKNHRSHPISVAHGTGWSPVFGGYRERLPFRLTWSCSPPFQRALRSEVWSHVSDVRSRAPPSCGASRRARSWA